MGLVYSSGILSKIKVFKVLVMPRAPGYGRLWALALNDCITGGKVAVAKTKKTLLCGYPPPVRLFASFAQAHPQGLNWQRLEHQ